MFILTYSRLTVKHLENYLFKYPDKIDYYDEDILFSKTNDTGI
jgi:hypothetical protein